MDGKTWKRLFFGNSLGHNEEKKIIKENRNEILALNRKNVIVLCSSLVLFSLISLVLTFMIPDFASARLLSLISLIIPVVGVLLQLPNFAETPYVAIYGTFLLMVFFSAYVSAYFAADHINVIILIAIVMFPVFYVDYTRRVHLFLVFGVILYIAMIWGHKSGIIMEKEVANVCLFAGISLLLGTFLRQAQLRNIELRRQLEIKASVDALTQIANRASFDTLTEGLKESALPVALVIMDIDGFKNINDTMGHMMGDEVLKKVASLLKDKFRLTDTAVRLGGDEFAVIMPGSTEESFELIKERLTDVNKRLRSGEDNLPPCSLSVGVAFSLNGYKDELYKFSDQALYEAKKLPNEKIKRYSEKSFL